MEYSASQRASGARSGVKEAAIAQIMAVTCIDGSDSRRTQWRDAGIYWRWLMIPRTRASGEAPAVSASRAFTGRMAVKNAEVRRRYGAVIPHISRLPVEPIVHGNQRTRIEQRPHLQVSTGVAAAAEVGSATDRRQYDVRRFHKRSEYERSIICPVPAPPV
jgi:hypothetical protein